MSYLNERWAGKRLASIAFDEYGCGIGFADGSGITAWASVKIELSYTDIPAIVSHVLETEEWVTVVFDKGTISLGRIPISNSPEFWMFTEPNGLTIVDNGD